MTDVPVFDVFGAAVSLSVTTWPETLQPAQCKFGRLNSDTHSMSPTTRTRQIVRRNRPLWQANITWKVKPKQVSEMRYQMERLNGGSECVKLRDYAAKPIARTGITLLSSAAILAVSLTLAGFPVSTSNVVRAGDYLELGGYLYIIAADASSNGSGQATVSLTSPLQVASAASSAVELAAPGRIMRQTSPDWSGSRSVSEGLWSVSMGWIERISDTA